MNVLKQLVRSFQKISMISLWVGSVFADPPKEESSNAPNKMPLYPPWCAPTIAAYNYPAQIEPACSYNVYTEMSFNYWQPSQENMELGQLDKGTITNITLSGLTTSSVATTSAFKAIDMTFDFKPGFTLGFGYHLDYDNWDVRAEYTWFHCSNEHSVAANDFLLFHTETQNISPTWGIFIQSQSDVNYQTASEKWELGMDIVDADIGRWCYVGSKLTFYPSVGVRSAFIRQKVHVSYINGFTDFIVDVPGLLGEGVFVGNKEVVSTSHSWAIGPKIALETNWLLGLGLRLFGNGEADLLYTRYTSLKEKTLTTGTVVGIIIVPFSFGLIDHTKGIQSVGSLRTHLDLELGVGWGAYLNSDKCYFDCSAGYDFQVFFDQNMFRHNVNDPGSFVPNGNLYIQGLITKARIDF